MRMTGMMAALAVAAAVAPARAEGPAAAIAPGSVLGVATQTTLGDAKRVLEGVDWVWETAFMVDFSASCAERDGVELFCALVYAADAPEDAFVIEALVISSPELATTDGVRVGMPIAEVEKIWGEAVFAFHTENESREYVTFENAPRAYSVRAGLPGQDAFHVGVYPAETGPSYYETSEYPPEAVIGSIWVN